MLDPKDVYDYLSGAALAFKSLPHAMAMTWSQPRRRPSSPGTCQMAVSDDAEPEHHATPTVSTKARQSRLFIAVGGRFVIPQTRLGARCRFWMRRKTRHTAAIQRRPSMPAALSPRILVPGRQAQILNAYPPATE